MDKRKLFLVSVLMACSICQAAYKSGFYVGVNAGGSYDYNKVDETNPVPASPISISSGKKIQSGAFQGGLFLGCLFRIPESKLLLGLEHSSNFSSFSKQWHSEDVGDVHYNSKLTRNYTGSFVLKFGGVLKEEWFLYALLGVDVSRFKFENSFSSELLDPGSDSCRKTLVGICYGFGIEREIYNHWRLGIEVKCTQYNSKRMLTKDADYSDELLSNFSSIYTGLRLSYAF